MDNETKHLWYPCSQMKDYEYFKPLKVVKARGARMELESGKPLIDAISSWWCKSLGHNHPRLKKALINQLEKFEHVIAANTTHDVILELSEKLSGLKPGLNKVFYAGDGSSAVEVAMKMSLQARQILGQSQKTEFIALENGYHGETLATLSVSDVCLYKTPFKAKTFDSQFIKGLPYVANTKSPLWQDASDYWDNIEQQLLKKVEQTTAIIIEPLLQGAGGMKIYSKDFLKRLAKFAKKHDIHLIADEIMTGLGRTGKCFAVDYADITPDFLLLSKGLTSGFMAMSCVLTHDQIYQLFYDDYESGKAFLHSHTYSGNALAASVALECLHVLKEEKLYHRGESLSSYMQAHFNDIAQSYPKLINIRSLGAMVAADINTQTPRAGFKVFQQAVQLGALLRPLGNTIYWLPPLNIKLEELDKLKAITLKALKAADLK